MERPNKVIIPKQLWQEEPEDELKRKVGGSYSAKEVDQYVDRLKINMRNMEAVYQERFEEMRTQILSVTRERDNAVTDKQSAEQKLASTVNTAPQVVDVDATLEKRGMKAVRLSEYQSLLQGDSEFRRTIGQLESKMKILSDENRRLAKELEDTEAVKKEAAGVVNQVKTTKEQLQQREEQLQQKTEELSLISIRLSEAEAAVRENAAELIQLRDKCTTYELESRLVHNEHIQLQNEKERIAKEAAVNKERWDSEREGLIRRYNVLLGGQKQCMQRLSDSVAEAIHYMESLGETAMKGYGSEE
jgi:uncharacterized phage infection (PIP) family protein YhgE